MTPALILGLHLLSAHAPAEGWQNNVNVGLYARHESGLTAGFYRNTWRRTSVYVGETFEAGRFALTVGAISGYRSGRVEAPCTYPSPGMTCTRDVSGTAGNWSALVVPSVVLPGFAGVSPRLSYIPPVYGHAQAVHLSVEWRSR